METIATARTASAPLQQALDELEALALPERGNEVRRQALEVAEVVRGLDADDEVVLAAALQPLLDANLLEATGAAKRCGDQAVRLARDLSQLGHFGLPADWSPEQGLDPQQAEALR